MDHSDSRVMAGLIFQGEKDIDLLDAVTRTAGALTGLCQDVKSLGFLSDQDAGVETEQYRVCLALSADMALPGNDTVAGTLLRIDVCRRDPADDSSGPAIDAVLARVVIELSDHLRPTHLQWVEPETILSSEDLAEAARPLEETAPLAPALDRQQIARARAALTGNDTDTFDAKSNARTERPPLPAAVAKAGPATTRTQKHVTPRRPATPAARTRQHNQQTDRLRLSAWLLSIAVACIALPIGLALVFVNILKGENLRLASQTAALSGLFVSLQANGATATAVEVVQTVLL